MSNGQQHRLIVPVTALLALVVNVVLFNIFYSKMSVGAASGLAAAVAFVLVVVIGLVFKPTLGD